MEDKTMQGPYVSQLKFLNTQFWLWSEAPAHEDTKVPSRLFRTRPWPHPESLYWAPSRMVKTLSQGLSACELIATAPQGSSPLYQATAFCQTSGLQDAALLSLTIGLPVVSKSNAGNGATGQSSEDKYKFHDLQVVG